MEKPIVTYEKWYYKKFKEILTFGDIKIEKRKFTILSTKFTKNI